MTENNPKDDQLDLLEELTEVNQALDYIKKNAPQDEGRLAILRDRRGDLKKKLETYVKRSKR